jgi:L-fucose mutarotase
MLKTKLAHPQILYALGKAGHGSRVLLADGDYPVSTTAGMNAEIVHLNLCAGIVNCTQILEALLPTILVEAAAVMDVPQGQAEPQIWATYRRLLSENGYPSELEKIERFAFYEETAGDNTALVIQTGETREYANLLLTIGSL